jgi:hypothetical protein
VLPVLTLESVVVIVSSVILRTGLEEGWRSCGLIEQVIELMVDCSQKLPPLFTAPLLMEEEAMVDLLFTLSNTELALLLAGEILLAVEE